MPYVVLTPPDTSRSSSAYMLFSYTVRLRCLHKLVTEATTLTPNGAERVPPAITENPATPRRYAAGDPYHFRRSVIWKRQT